MSGELKSFWGMALVTVGLVVMSPVLGEWSDDPTARTPICTADYAQYAPRLVQVDGGFVVTWQDQRRENANIDVYAQKFTIDGEMLWPENGRVIAEGPAGSLAYQWQSSAGLAHDGDGGALVAWNDYYAPYYSYFQGFITRAGADATVAWGDPGNPIQAPDTAVPLLANPVMGLNQMSEEWGIAADSEGGLFVPIPGIPHSVARFAPDGRQRTDWYSVPGESANTVYLDLVPAVESGDDDSVMVAWVSNVSLADDNILVRKLMDSETSWPTVPDTLTSSWGAEPVQLDDDPATTDAVTIANVCRLEAVPDGSGGIIVVWMDDRIRPDTSYYRVYAQRVDALGNPLWPEGGIEVSGDVMTYTCYWWARLAAVADGEGGVVITWNEIQNDPHTLKAQRLDADGNAQWVAGGVIVDTDGLISYSPQTVALVHATDGNPIVLYSLGTTYLRPQELVAQKLAAEDGGLLWDERRIVYEGCIPNAVTDYTKMISDGRAGAIVAYATCNEQDIYAHRVEELRCEGDFDSDGDVDGSDLAAFSSDFGRIDCNADCSGDFDTDGDVDGSDLALFSADFGRVDCPVPGVLSGQQSEKGRP